MEWLQQYLTELLADNGTLGAASFAILAWLFHELQKATGKELNQFWKTAISLALPFALALSVYHAGVYFEFWEHTKMNFNNALAVAAKEVIGSRLLRATFGAIEDKRDKAKQAENPDSLMNPNGPNSGPPQL